jgi:hypothetical protein
MSAGTGTVPPRAGDRPAGSARRVVVGRGAHRPARTDARAQQARPYGALPRAPNPQDAFDPHVRYAVPDHRGPARRAAAGGGGPGGRTGADRHAASWSPSRPRVRFGGGPASLRRAQARRRRAVRKGPRGSGHRWPGRPVPSPPRGPGRPIGPRPEGPPALAGRGRARRSPVTPGAPAYQSIGERPSRLKPATTGFRRKLYFGGCPRAGGGGAASAWSPHRLAA